MTGPQIIVDGNVEPIDRLIQYLTTFDDHTRKIFYQTAVEVFDELRAQMLAAFQFYPFAAPGSTYKRTFRLQRGWQIDLTLANDTVTVTVFNPTPYTKWVVGTLTNVEAVARKTQRHFHARNGWPLALYTAEFWFDKYKTAFIEAFIEALIADIKKRGTKG